TTSRAQSGPTRSWSSSIRTRRGRFIRTTADGSCGRSSSPRPDIRSAASGSGLATRAIRLRSSGSTSPRRSSHGGSCSGRGRCSTPAWRTRSASRWRGRSPRRRKRSWGCARLRSFHAPKRRRRSPPGRAGWPRTSGSGCAGSPASLPCGPTVLRTRWPMTFSRWCAAGNEYLLVERAELGDPLTPEGVQAQVGDADGILEVVGVQGEEAEILIWNPDGSLAEMSGNGTRIAARWLAERSGAEVVSIRVAGRSVTARLLPDGRIEQDVGRVEVYERERVAGLQVTC